MNKIFFLLVWAIASVSSMALSSSLESVMTVRSTDGTEFEVSVAEFQVAISDYYKQNPSYKATETFTNGDGSITFSKPRVQYKGDFAYILESRGDVWGYDAARGFCRLLGFEKMTSRGLMALWKDKKFIRISKNGDVTSSGTLSEGYFGFLESVTCK